MVYSQPVHNGKKGFNSRQHVRNLSTGAIHEFNSLNEAQTFISENTVTIENAASEDQSNQVSTNENEI